MDKGRFLLETHLRTGRPIAELATAHGMHRSWLYKRLARYRAEGEAGLEPRSRRPHRSPTRITDRYEDDIVALRKELDDAGYDSGAETIQIHLARLNTTVPSVSTIWRVLKARGFVTPQPHKRPKSSYVRFEAELPNECWQADVTHVAMADGTYMEILNIVDDHSRLCVASRAFVTTRSPDVVRTLHKAAERLGLPESLLTDNGAIFTASPRRNDSGAIEPELLSLGIRSKHSRPYHPQTCGKLERFHQTLKRHLAKQVTATTKKQLQVQLRCLRHLLQRRASPPRPRSQDTVRGLCRARALLPPRADDRLHRLSGAPRQDRSQGQRDLAPQGPAAPHRDRSRLPGVASRDARGGARRADPQPRRGIPPPPDLDPTKDYQPIG